MTPAQLTWLEALRQVRGIEVYVWRPADLEAVARLLGRQHVQKERKQ